VIHRSADIPHQYPVSGDRDNRIYMTVGLLDGLSPYVVLQVGIYPREHSWTRAYDATLQPYWVYYMEPNPVRDPNKNRGGSHMIRTADLDGDGTDEVLHGGYCLNGDGTLRWERGLFHPDVTAPADVRPDVPGLEVLYAVEQPGAEDLATLLVTKDGDSLWEVPRSAELYHGHGAWAANVRSNPGLECYVKYSMDDWGYRLYSAAGQVLEEHGFLRPIDWNGGALKSTAPPPLTGRKQYYVADVTGDYREEYIVLPMGGGANETARFTGELIVFTNTANNPNGKAPSPWEDHLYSLDQTWTGYR